MTNPDTHIREMIAARLTEYQLHHANATGYLATADDSACDCEPSECECSEPWERTEYVAAAQVEATLANAAATAMAALIAFMEKATS